METKTKGGKEFLVFSVEQENEQILITATSGYSKTLTAEKFAEEAQKQGFVVIFVADVKDTVEAGFCQFPPQREYHLKHLKRHGLKPSTINAKIYHPLTTEIPRQKIPDCFKFFSIAIKDMNADDFSFFFELLSGAQEPTSVRYALEILSKLNNDSTVYEFKHLVEKYGKPPFSSRLYTSEVTKSDVGKIKGNLREYIENYMFYPKNFELDFDFKKILQDNSVFHIFTTCFIKKTLKKRKNFVINWVFKMLAENLKYATHPVLFVIEEIRKFIPKEKNARGYEKIMSKVFGGNLALVRSSGKHGAMSVSTSQVYYDVGESVQDSVTMHLAGHISSKTELKRTVKDLGYKSDVARILDSLGKGEFVIFGESGEIQRNDEAIYSSYGHKERGLDFFEMWHKYYPDRYFHTKEILDAINLQKAQAKRKYDELRLKDKKENIISKQKEEKKLTKEKQQSTKLNQIKEKLQVSKKEQKDERNKRILELNYEMLTNPSSDLSLRKIAKLVGVTHPVVINVVNTWKNNPKKFPYFQKEAPST